MVQQHGHIITKGHHLGTTTTSSRCSLPCTPPTSTIRNQDGAGHTPINMLTIPLTARGGGGGAGQLFLCFFAQLGGAKIGKKVLESSHHALLLCCCCGRLPLICLPPEEEFLRGGQRVDVLLLVAPAGSSGSITTCGEHPTEVVGEGVGEGGAERKLQPSQRPLLLVQHPLLPRVHHRVVHHPLLVAVGVEEVLGLRCGVVVGVVGVEVVVGKSVVLRLSPPHTKHPHTGLGFVSWWCQAKRGVDLVEDVINLAVLPPHIPMVGMTRRTTTPPPNPRGAHPGLLPPMKCRHQPLRALRIVVEVGEEV